ncbi:hypothetical protein BCV70DRAFT_160658 [Testicularia cyperi]|uniref:SUN domain-containing protein n=1 Tax=Testicularia cyperi TaxID=1882483 RepID=A0A317XSD8_9BASI|nr:hypothetical protein BCV70DRAFT_160658 [Testicularia cyperi]
MSYRRNGQTPVRRSPRISGRSETPMDREGSMSVRGTPRLASPEVIEQMTPPMNPSSRFLQTRAGPSYNFSTMAIKQEDASMNGGLSSYFLREQSQSQSVGSPSGLASPPSAFGSRLLRGAQFGLFDDQQNGNASASIFSSASSERTASYHQEEQMAEQLQSQDQHREANGRRRVSGPRKGRPSLDAQPYKPTRSEEEDDDDDDVRPGPRRRRKSTKSGPQMRQGEDDNHIWMGKARKRRARRSNGNSVEAAEPGSEDDDQNDVDDDDDDDEGELSDAGGTSRKETRIDTYPAPDAYAAEDGLHFAPNESLLQGRPGKEDDILPRHSLLRSLAAALVSFVLAILRFTLGTVSRAPLRLLRGLGSVAHQYKLRDIALTTAAIVTTLSALYIATQSGSTLSSSDGILSRPSGSSGLPRWSLSDDDENKRLRAEIERLHAKIESLPSQLDSRLNTRMTEVEAKLLAETAARKEAEFNKLLSNAKRQVSRLAQDELRAIQDNVSNSVELMLRELNKKVDDQLKKRADATQDEFFSHLDKEIAKITSYANAEVNSKLKQSFDETFLTSLIHESLETYSRDRTGKFDYAAVTSGAVLDQEGTVHRGYRYNSIWNLRNYLAQGRKVAIGSPIKAITPGAELGADNCWMTGWNSILQVNLSSTKVIDEVVLEHPLPGMLRTAPRRVIVWGLVDESDRQYYQHFRRMGGRDPSQYIQELLPEPFAAAIPHEYRLPNGDMPLILSHFEFKADGSTLQTFNTTEEAQFYPYGIEAVRVQFIDGWAAHPPICVHRVRLHGSQWPVFASDHPAAS